MQKKNAKTGKKPANRKKVRTRANHHAGGPSSVINIGDVSNITGEVTVAGGSITSNRTMTSVQATTGMSASEIRLEFDKLYKAIETREGTPSDQKVKLESEVKEIESALSSASSKDKDLDEGFLLRHFRNIARMAPDVLDVVVKTMANPALGLGEVAAKIAKKAMETSSS